MTDTPNLGLPFIEGGQAQKHVTHNEALRILDAAIQIAVRDVTRTVPPASPAEGVRHVVAVSATGAWTGHAQAIATWQDGAWAFLVPKPGWCVWSVADDGMMVFDGTLWRVVGTPSLDGVPQLGINTVSNAGNRLSVSSNAALFAAIDTADGGSGDVRVQLSKEGAAKTASVYFSDNHSGRAEFGLVESNTFKLKVSPDGASWVEALTIDPATGHLALPRGVALTGVCAPSSITANQNDYNPAGLASASVLQISSDAARSISGLSGGAEGRIVTVINVGSQPITLLDESTASSVANRFTLSGNLTIAGKQAVVLRYDGTAMRWQAIAGGTGTVNTAAAQALTATQQAQGRSNLYAAPFDALAYNGMQVNGHHDISQQNGSSPVSITTGASSTYITDNWRFYKTGTSALSLQRVASGIDGIPFALQATVTTAQASIGSDVALFGTYIEGSRVARAAWGTASAVPISGGFWFKAAVAGSYTVMAYNFDGLANQSTTFALALANSWTFVTFTLAAKTTGTWKTDTSIGLDLQIYLAGVSGPNNFGTNANICAITGLIVLPGLDVPSSAQLPRILRPADEEFMKCARLWQTFGGQGSGSGSNFGAGVFATTTIAVISLPLITAMRIVPALTISTASDFQVLDGAFSINPSAITLDAYANNTAVTLNVTMSGASPGKGAWLRSANTNARMHFNARF